MEMNQCKIVQDLMPLYFDDLCSPETKQFIEEHLETCECCKTYFEEMTEGIVPKSTFENMRTEITETMEFVRDIFAKAKDDGEDSETVVESISSEIKETNDFVLHLSKRWKRQKLTSVLTVAAFVIFLFFAALIPLTKIECVNVPTSEINVKTVDNPDGSFTYTLKVIDNNFTQVRMFQDIEDGIFVMYFTPTRPLLNITPQSRRKEYAMAVKDVTIYPDEHYFGDENDSKLQKFYIGTPKDRILIWERK